MALKDTTKMLLLLTAKSVMDFLPAHFLLLQTKRSDFMETHYDVKRRYSDFVWMRKNIETSLPLLFLPVSGKRYKNF